MQTEGLALAITGASGMPYALRLLEQLLQKGERIQLMVSDAARVVLKLESDIALPARPRDMEAALRARYQCAQDQLEVFGREQWTAPVASGSSPPRALVICPCSTGTLAAVATGLSRNLIERTADVVLKERRSLVLVPRETPLSTVHLENMLRLSRLGATILPPAPGFYHRPQGVQDLVDFVVARVLDHLEVEHALGPRWGRAPDE